MEHVERILDCVVIGGGPGGLVSALYLKRFKREIVVVNSGRSRAKFIPKIKNLIGCKGLTGDKLLGNLKTQVSELKTKIIKGDARIERDGKLFIVKVNRRRIHTKKIILATGVEDIHPPIPNFFQLARKNVLGYCVVCDGFEYCDQPIAIIAKDSNGLSKIPYIARYSKDLKLILIEDFDIPSFYQKIITERKITVYRGKLLKLRARTNPIGLAVHLKNQKAIPVRLAYASLGVKVRDSAFRELRGLRKTAEGYLLTSPHQVTSIPGLYAVGDCVNTLSQVSVAVGQAAIAATDVHNDLLKKV